MLKSLNQSRFHRCLRQQGPGRNDPAGAREDTALSQVEVLRIMHNTVLRDNTPSAPGRADATSIPSEHESPIGISGNGHQIGLLGPAHRRPETLFTQVSPLVSQRAGCWSVGAPKGIRIL